VATFGVLTFMTFINVAEDKCVFFLQFVIKVKIELINSLFKAS